MTFRAAVPTEIPAFERRLRPRSTGSLLAIDYLRQNYLLAALANEELLRLQSRLELVAMPRGQVLGRPGAARGHMYFPITSIVSMFHELADGVSSEIAVVGKEGVVGLPVILGGASSSSRAVVLSAGYGYRITAQYMLDEVNRAGPVLYLLLRYAQALMTQITQTAVCNRHHMRHQQLCRLLLSILDRQESNHIVLTQNQIAALLDTRRETVSNSAEKLKNDGIIQYRRGHIDVLERHGLEQGACECYQVVKREYERLLVQSIDRESAMHCGNPFIEPRRFVGSIATDD